ncbi:MAG: DMT family transporter [Deltaproteobacteria bacterium]|nr:DMT family transporter [Deltaproteobacteria bacterium]
MRAVGLAVLAAALFGAATPTSKLLLSDLSPFQLAGLLYLGAAVGVLPAARRGGGIRLPDRSDQLNRLRLLGAVVAGGICGPVLLLLGLRVATATSVSLWLTFETAATALLGTLVFRDHLGLRGWAGVACALAGAGLLALPSGPSGMMAGGLVLLACVCWGLDNHLTALIDGMTPSQSTFWKGLVAGTTNLVIGLVLAPLSAGLVPLLAALFVGIWAYGASIVLYITSAQALGGTRAQVAFASAPLFGVIFSVLLLAESLSPVHGGSALLFIAGVGLLTLENHAHTHEHDAAMHEHAHRHDDGHHDHEHPGPAPLWHSHRHVHEATAHGHRHWPDLHHRHGHGGSG